MIASSINEITLVANQIYYFVKLSSNINFSVSLEFINIVMYENNSIIGSEGIKVFKFTTINQKRVNINLDQSHYSIFNDSYSCIAYDHGYLLQSGEYYIIIDIIGNYSFCVTNYTQQVEITLYDGEEIVTNSIEQSYLYDEEFTLPVLSKNGYDFNGWKLNNNVMITNSNGIGLTTLLWDCLIVYADWTAQCLTMEIKLDDNSAIWWNGSELVENKPNGIIIDGSLYSQLVNLKSQFTQQEYGKKVGHYLITFTIEKDIEVENNYMFIPVWGIEKYYIVFNTMVSNTIISDNIVTYGELIQENSLPGQIYSIMVNGYSFKGWTLDVNNDIITSLSIGSVIPDLTPNVASSYNYEFPGDGIYANSDNYNCTKIDMYASMEKEIYNLTVQCDGTTCEVINEITCEDTYILKAPSDYSMLRIAQYQGKNVYYRDNNGQTYNVGDIITNIYGNIILNLQTSEINVLIDYTSNLAIDFKNPNLQYATALILSTMNYSLLPAESRLYGFSSWKCNGNSITILNKDSINIQYDNNDYKYFSRKNNLVISVLIQATWFTHTLNPNNYSDYTIDNDVTYVNCATDNAKHNITFTVAKSAQKVTFVGNNKKWRDTRIVIEDRSTALYLNFNGIHFYAPSGKSVIDATLCQDLYLYSFGSYSILEAGEATAKEENQQLAAILCYNLTLEGYKFKINGGDAWVYLLRKNGTYGILAQNNITIDCAVSIVGGYGANGTIGKAGADGTSIGENGQAGGKGNTGGAGACGICCYGQITLTTLSSGTITGGEGGKGGTGGTGGTGAEGRNGKFLVPTKKPGDGGAGGKGGDGGTGARAINSRFVNNGSVKIVAGEGGEGGDGGTGGSPGDAVKTITDKTVKGSQGASGQLGTHGSSGV